MTNKEKMILKELRALAEELQEIVQHTDIVTFCYMATSPEEITNHLNFYIEKYSK